ncbi:MAG: aromatic amino acid transport family protein [bacterium]|nr:aromatic amino acid transport family protein [bacterium]
MRAFNSKFIQAVAFLSGMIIGVGMFGIPFVFSRVGFWAGVVELVVLTGIVMLFHLMYGEVVLRTPVAHRLPGYAGLYGGKKLEILSSASYLFGISGAMLAYVLIGGTFLGGLAGISVFTGSIFFLVGGIVITFFNLRIEAEANYILTIVMAILIFVLVGLTLPHVEPANLAGFSPAYLFLPYGVLLFSLSGGIVIPEIVEFLGDEKKKLKKVIIIGSLIPMAVYFLFAFGVVGTLGGATSGEAIAGLLPVLGERVVQIGNGIGLLATFTSFVMLGFVLEGTLKSDFGFSRYPAWLIASLVPVVLFWTMGGADFIRVIGVVGAVAIGIDSTIALFVFLRAKAKGERAPEYSLRLPRFAAILLGLMFVAGAAYELWGIFAGV